MVLKFIWAKVPDLQNYPLNKTYGLTGGSKFGSKLLNCGSIFDLAELKSSTSPEVLIHYKSI